MDESINGKDLKNHEIIKNSGSTANHNLNDDIEEKAINLITFDQKEGFQVSPEAIDLLKNIKEKIGIIAVAGKYRTGKSFLLNRIILNKTDQSGFGVGPTINPCTKGLWIWNKPIEIDNRAGEPPFKVFIVDSEGIGAFNEDQNHDTRIFLLALLLSSYFVYNSMGTIDENALQNLSLIVNLSKQLQIKNQKAEEADPDEVSRYFPSFLWVVRDFALRLLDQYGNTINSKEYLENALKEQKGTSDNVEKKNRIRRLILNFFKDRDCYTMVRPTEEEKDLQNLQKMNDEKLRPEFIEQMIALRSRIFKRVKPKVLNGRFITGEMFLELCQAYTTAINKGSVPCIESAWTYLCQNESQRAIQESIALYEKELKIKAFLNLKQNDCINYNELKQLHKKLKDESILYFKQKAVGENLKDYEVKILEEIQKRFILVKQKCLQIYESKCQTAIQKDVESIESMIRQDLYPTFQDFHKDLEKLKQTFSQVTDYIIYVQKDAVIRGISEKLILKAYEAISRKEKEQLTNLNRQLKEKANYLEKDLQNKKQDYDQERNVLQNKLLDIQSEIQTLRANNKILEERNKLLDSDRQKLELQLTEKNQQLNEQKDKIENKLNIQLKELQNKLRAAEDMTMKSQISFEKEGALKDQKLIFLERDNSVLTSRVDQLFNENKSLMEKVAFLESQLKQTEVHVKVKDEEKKKEIDLIKEFFQKKIDKSKNNDSNINSEKQKQWDQEKQFLQEQLLFSQKQLEENKKMHEVLLQAITNSNKQQQEQAAAVMMNNSKNIRIKEETDLQIQQHQQQQQQLLQMNKNLTETIAKVEQRNHSLQSKLSQIKIYQRVFKHSQSMQCKFCQVFFPSEIFIEHVKTCNKDNRYTRSHFFQIPLSVSIQQTRINVDPIDNRQYTEYVVQVNFNEKTWVLNQKYKSFCQLHEKLINQYPNIKFPQSSFQFSQKSLNDFGNIKGRVATQGGTGSASSSLIEDRRKILQQYLQDLALIPAIKESSHLKIFLGIDQNFPEFCDDVLLQQSQNQLITGDSMVNSNAQRQLGKFKIITDLFQKKITNNVNMSTIINKQNNDEQQINGKVSMNENQIINTSMISAQAQGIIDDLVPRNLNFEIEDLIKKQNNGFNNPNYSINMGLQNSIIKNRYEDLSNNNNINPMILSHQNFDENQNDNHNSRQIKDQRDMEDDLSSIEGVLLDDDNTRFYADDNEEVNVDQNYYDDDDYYHNYQKQPQPSESPISYQKNKQQQQQQIEKDQKHIDGLLKKSISSNNLVYSPSQIQSQMTSVLFNDKTNQNIKYTQSINNQLPAFKENCVACSHKKSVENQQFQTNDMSRMSQENSNIISMISKNGNGQNPQYMKSSINNFQEVINQSQDSQISIRNASSLLDELVSKSQSGLVVQQSQNSKIQQDLSQAIMQQRSTKITNKNNFNSKVENFITPRDNQMINTTYMKTEQTMRSDKILQDLFSKDKTQVNNNTLFNQNKKMTPVKNVNQKGINVNHSSIIQSSKSPFQNQKQSNAGIGVAGQLGNGQPQSLSQQQINQSNVTPDQSQRKIHHASELSMSLPFHKSSHKSVEKHSSLKKQQQHYDTQNRSFGKSGEKIRLQTNNNNYI